MKLKVVTKFRDKYNPETVFMPGKIVEIEDDDRSRDLIKRGLCTEYKPKNAPAASKAGKSKSDKTPEVKVENSVEESTEPTEVENQNPE
ncbi:MAG: hypothetical protein J1E16_09630 [Muribaculaceae bacterium]|nr:hypothetical protein [Muribaculaceae bacterium]